MSKTLNDYTKEELIDLVQGLKRRKKFGLVWEDKPEKVVQEVEAKLPVVTEIKDRAILTLASQGDYSPTHLIIEGDNYHSLSVLNYTHAGKIDVIYIDPPYNTGNQDFIYNDNYVDKEDGYRHSKWLSFISKRLKLARELLADTGVVFISIDDNEQAHLRLLCDEVFGKENFVENFIWKSRLGKGATSTTTAKLHEYVICYAKNYSLVEFKTDRRIAKTASKERVRQWGHGDRREDRPTMYYPVMSEEFGEVYPKKPDGTDGRWRVGKSSFEQLQQKGLIVFEKQNDGRIEAYKIKPEGHITETAYSSIFDN